MKNRELILRKLGFIENSTRKMDGYLNRGSQISEFREELVRIRELAEDISSMIDREPLSPGEINPLR